MKKYIFTLFALLMAVMTASAQASTTYFVELTADSRPTGVSFTLTYQLGSAAAVDVSEFLNGDEHAAPAPAGAKMTLTVTPAQGYVAGTVTGETFMNSSEMRVRTRGNDPEISILGDVEITQSTTNPNVFTYTQPTANVRLTVSYLKMVTVTADNQIKQAELGVTMAGMPGISEEFANAFPGMDVSAFTKIEEEGDLYFRPYTRNTTVWEDALQQTGCFLDAWQDPSDPAKMEAACDAAQQIIETAIANE
jgi:hypothetical protein